MNNQQVNQGQSGMGNGGRGGRGPGRIVLDQSQLPKVLYERDQMHH